MTLQYTEGVEAFTLAPFTGLLGWTKEQVEVNILHFKVNFSGFTKRFDRVCEVKATSR